jgi:hypothetical protein
VPESGGRLLRIAQYMPASSAQAQAGTAACRMQERGRPVAASRCDAAARARGAPPPGPPGSATTPCYCAPALCKGARAHRARARSVTAAAARAAARAATMAAAGTTAAATSSGCCSIHGAVTAYAAWPRPTTSQCCGGRHQLCGRPGDVASPPRPWLSAVT